MPVWLAFVDVIRVLLFGLAHIAGGSVGAAIFALSVIVRLALLPLSVKVALRAKQQGDALRALEPELKLLRERFAKQPDRLVTETRALHAKHGVVLMPRIALVNMLVQMPIGMAVYRVITGAAANAGRFLWIRDLARPDALLVSLAALASALSVLLAPAAPGSTRGMAVAGACMAALVTAVVAWRLASGVGLYWVGTSVVGVAQSLIVRRAVAREVRRSRT